MSQHLSNQLVILSGWFWHLRLAPALSENLINRIVNPDSSTDINRQFAKSDTIIEQSMFSWLINCLGVTASAPYEFYVHSPTSDIPVDLTKITSTSISQNLWQD